MQTQRSELRAVIIGHRGAKGLAPENTLAGFEKAIETGVDMIETDVQQTKDGVLILVHDPHLTTPEKQRVIIRHTNYQELLEHDPTIPTLEATIKHIDRRARIMIEIKDGVPTAPVAQIIRSYLAKGWLPEDFMFNSAHYTVLRELKAELPHVERIIQGKWSGVRVTYLARKLETPYILLDQRYLWWGFVKSVSRKYKLCTYTYPWWEHEPYKHHKASRWIKYGLWGIVTDYPDHYRLPQ